MNVSLEWLREFVNTPTPAVELGEKFRMTSSECEGVEDWSEKLSGIVVGHVKKLVQHPNADRLRVATVDVGNQTKTIVCGGVNLEEKQFVLVALDGALLHPVKGEPFTIKETEIRGVKSEGMICALEEIGIPINQGDHCIFFFDTPQKPGESASKALFGNDSVIDLEITPNRPDLLGHFGLAREVATFEGRKLIEPPIATLRAQDDYPFALDIHIEHPTDCPRFSMVGIELPHGAVASPWWLQSRLLRCGIRPINIVVDVCNYVMLELGQPLHAYDLQSLKPGTAKKGIQTIRVQLRQAQKGEKIGLLDGTTRDLEPGDLLVTDTDNTPIDLLGIMGSESTAVQPGSKTIVLEAMVCAPEKIRKTSRRLGLRSEASMRFEKGIDPENSMKALKRALYLLEKHADARVIAPVTSKALARKEGQARIHLTFDRIIQVLGVRITAADCKSILMKLGFQIPTLTKSGLECVPPSWRPDVELPEDVIEELIRIWGYEHIPRTLPSGFVKAPTEHPRIQAKSVMRHTAAALGYRETIHISFASEQALEKTNIPVSKALALPNPLSKELAYLIPTHAVPLLTNCGTVNIDQTELKLLEIGQVFAAPHSETEFATLLLRTSASPEDALRHLKTDLARLMQTLHFGTPAYAVGEALPYAQQVLQIMVNDTVCGTLSLIDAAILEKHKIRRGRTVVLAELNLNTLLALPAKPVIFESLSVYPSSERDFTINLPTTTPIQAVTDTLTHAVDTNLVRDWAITTIFTGKPLPADTKAVTIHFTYNSPNRTLSEEEITAHQQTLEAALQRL